MTESKKIFILGDSYSTYEGFVPEGYAVYYHPNSERDAKVSDVSLTWWGRYLKNTNSTLLRNCSWSGTTICHTGYDGADKINNSFITRMEKLIDEGFFKENKPDTLFVFGGTNDSWANAPLGEKMYSGWDVKDLYCVLPAICYLLNLLKKNFSETRIICLLNSGVYKKEITDTFIEACEKYNIEYIKIEDFEMLTGHPTELGMEQIEKMVRDGMTNQ